MIDEPLPLTALLAVVVAVAFALETRTRVAGRIGASLLVIVFGALLSNLGVVPARSPVYDVLTGPVTSLAIVWLLFGVRLHDLRNAGGRMIAAFLLGCAATALGAVTASILFARHFGENAWKLAGVLTGTYSGGSLNFVGVGRAVELPEDLFAAATAADNLVTALWMGACLLLPVWLAGSYPARTRAPVSVDDSDSFQQAEIRLPDLAALLALGLAVVWLGEAVGARLPGPSIIWLTTTALVVAQVPVVQKLKGSLLLGVLSLNLFFVAIGVASRIREILAEGLEILYLTLAVVAIHGLVLFVVGRLLRFDVETLSVASQAAIGGPSTAIALTTARRWPDLTLPGAAVGLAGYGLGTYAGVGIAALVRSML